MQAHDSHARAACIVWHPRAAAMPPGLAEALARSGCTTLDVDNEFEAVARACGTRAPRPGILLVVDPTRLSGLAEALTLVDRADPAPVLWKYESGPSPHINAVTQVDRDAWSQPAAERDVAFPTAASQPAAASQAPARAATPVPATIARLTDDAASTRRVKMPEAPRLRLAGEAAEVPAPPHVETKPKATSPSYNAPPEESSGEDVPPVQAPGLLTDEELAMLLAIEPEKRHK